jgi:pimeloyl-ACP methyl ester carboxylesterase
MSSEVARIDPSIRHGYAQVGGLRLHYAQRGSGEKLVLFLHGFPECWYSWRYQLPIFGDEYTVVAPDMRGYNLSDKPARVEDYRMDLLVDDVLGLIRHFGAKRAAVVGHDWGAGVAWSVALRNPEYVSKLAAFQVPPLAAWRANLTWRQALHSWYMFFFLLPALPEWWIRRGDFALLEDMFKKTMVHKENMTEVDLAVYKQALREKGALTAAINYYRANVPSFFFKSRDPKFGSRAVQAPTLFVYGERDHAIIPSSVRGVGIYVDGPYRELRIPNSGHWVQQDAYHQVNDALLDFLDSN